MKTHTFATAFLLAALLFVPFGYIQARVAAVDNTKISTVSEQTNEGLEAEVREYFKDVPVMIEIARCESKFRQFTDSGAVLNGGSAGGMIGIFQFFGSIHTNIATSLGYDIATVDGNLAYARHLYESEGTTPWNAAKDCWGTAEKVTASVSVLETNKKLQEQITLLLKIIELLTLLQAK